MYALYVNKTCIDGIDTLEEVKQAIIANPGAKYTLYKEVELNIKVDVEFDETDDCNIVIKEKKGSKKNKKKSKKNKTSFSKKQEKNVKKKNIKYVVQRTLDGDYVASFNDHIEAGHKLGIKTSDILRVLKGQRKSAHGYQWSYE